MNTKQFVKQKVLIIFVIIIMINLTSQIPRIQVASKININTDLKIIPVKTLIVQEAPLKIQAKPIITIDTINNMDMNQISEFTAQQIESILQYKLVGLGQTYYNAEQQYHVNALFLVAISALESGWGRSSIAVGRNNLCSYKNSHGRYAYFNSVQDCLNTVANGLSINYLNTTGQWYYNGFTIKDINYHYCTMDNEVTPKYSWSDQISKLMLSFYQNLS